jgi:hypothetical protein
MWVSIEALFARHFSEDEAPVHFQENRYPLSKEFSKIQILFRS